MPHLGRVEEPVGVAPSLVADREVFVGTRMTNGSVECGADDPEFRPPAQVRGYRVVFPCQSVWILPRRSPRYVSDPTVVEYYNDGDEFAREPLDPRGDRTHWYQ